MRIMALRVGYARLLLVKSQSGLMGQNILLVKTSSLGDAIPALPAISDACARGAADVVKRVVEEPFVTIPHVHAGVAERLPVHGQKDVLQLLLVKTRSAPAACILYCRGEIRASEERCKLAGRTAGRNCATRYLTRQSSLPTQVFRSCLD